MSETCCNCGWENTLSETPEYCPECGEEWGPTTAEDVDWPVEVQLAPRPNIRRLVAEETGVPEEELDELGTDHELLLGVEVYRDGTVKTVDTTVGGGVWEACLDLSSGMPAADTEYCASKEAAKEVVLEKFREQCDNVDRHEPEEWDWRGVGDSIVAESEYGRYELWVRHRDLIYESDEYDPRTSAGDSE